MEKNQAYNAVIVTVSDEAKTKSNGKFYSLCTVKFTDGPLANKTYFAQRTLGEDKAAVTVGQNVKAILNIVTNEDGTKRPFFEISTSMVDNTEDILTALGI